jgi:hypothetical protein
LYPEGSAHLQVERLLSYRRRRKFDNVVGHKMKLRSSHKTMPGKSNMLGYAPSFRPRLQMHMLNLMIPVLLNLTVLSISPLVKATPLKATMNPKISI